MKIFILLCLFILTTSCASFKPERLDYSAVNITDAKHTMGYGVYTPPNWDISESLPVILFLHGGGGSQFSFERHGAAEYLDKKINEGEIPRVIIVTPNGNNGFWENWADGSFAYRDWVLNEVFPKVQRDYQTLQCPEHCHLVGISMGGFGVLRMAYLKPGVFSSVSSISAPIYSDKKANEQATSLLVKLFFPLKRIFGENPNVNYRQHNPYNSWVNDKQQQEMRLQLIWGDQDHKKIKLANEEFHQRLVNHDVEHDYYVYDGKHKWVDWIPNLDRVINFSLDSSSRLGTNK